MSTYPIRPLAADEGKPWLCHFGLGHRKSVLATYCLYRSESLPPALVCASHVDAASSAFGFDTPIIMFRSPRGLWQDAR